MNEDNTPLVVLTVSKDKVAMDGDLAIVQTGLTIEEFIAVILKYAMSPKKTLAVEKISEEGE